MTQPNSHRHDETDRERGILTQADREFLLGGKKDLQPQSKRETRQRIRGRFENSLLDLFLLSRALDDKDRKMVSEKIFPNSNLGNTRLNHIFSLLFHMTWDTSPETEVAINRLENSLENSVESSLKRIEDSMIINVGANIDVESRDPDIESLLEKYERNEETLDELSYLRRQDEIEVGDEYYTHLFERLWETGSPFGFPKPSGEMNILDPSEFDEKAEFVQEALEQRRTMITSDSSSLEG